MNNPYPPRLRPELRKEGAGAAVLDRDSAEVHPTRQVDNLVIELADDLRRAERAHGEHAQHDDAEWPTWYARYLVQLGWSRDA